MKPYNGMTLWGRIGAINLEKKKGGGKYLQVKLQCPHKEYGAIRIYCNVFGKKAAGLAEAFKARDNVRVRGFMSQYEKKGSTRTSVSAFDIEEWDPGTDQHSENRAVFVLVGKVLSFCDGKDEGVAEVEIKEGEDPLKVCIPSDLSLDIEEGKKYRLKGTMQKEEDELGDLVKPQRPVVLEIKGLDEEEGEEGKVDDIPF